MSEIGKRDELDAGKELVVTVVVVVAAGCTGGGMGAETRCSVLRRKSSRYAAEDVLCEAAEALLAVLDAADMAAQQSKIHDVATGPRWRFC